MFSEAEFELNYREPNEAPTLVATSLLENRLDFQLNYTVHAEQACLDRCAIHIHAFHIKIFEHLFLLLTANCENTDFYITTDSDNKHNEILRITRRIKPSENCSIEINVVANQGRNIGALHSIFEQLMAYPLALHIHTKKSDHCSIGEAWLNDLLLCLTGSKSQINAIRAAFQNHSELGLIMPRPFKGIRPDANWGRNYECAAQISSRIFDGRIPSRYSPLAFPTGMMFWFRPTAIRKLIQPLGSWLTFPPEPLPKDGTSLHAIERIVAHCCEAEGFNWALCRPEEYLFKKLDYEPIALSLWYQNTDLYINATAEMAAKLRIYDEQRRSLKWLTEATLRRLFWGPQAVAESSRGWNMNIE